MREESKKSKKFFESNKNSNDSHSIERHYRINEELSGILIEDTKVLKKIFEHFSDMVYKEFKINGTYNAMLFFIDGFVDIKTIKLDILKHLLDFRTKEFKRSSIQLQELTDYIKNEITSVFDISNGANFREISDHVLSGEAVLLVNGIKDAIFINLREYEKRGIEDSEVEPVIRGPRDSFTEDIRTNISLIRRRLKSSKLKMEEMKVGELSKTKVVISYIEGISESSLVKEVKKRISSIDIDAILESGYIEEFIEDNHYSPFSQLGYTERPDKLAGSLLEGQVGILIDNTPEVLIAPQTFFQAMQSREDYYERGILSSAVRFSRYIYLLIALFLPAYYIAILNYHQGMIPRILLISILNSRENVPFPVVVESFIMEFFFEGLREAGIRLPGIAGQTVSIVGALVIGQAAVQANIVSASTVIIVSITGISSFIIPKYNLALTFRLLRFGMMILAGVLGFFGMYMGILCILIHMAKLNSFGVPYLSPLAPSNVDSLKDVFVRVPRWAMKKRPGFIQDNNLKRMKKKL